MIHSQILTGACWCVNGKDVGFGKEFPKEKNKKPQLTWGFLFLRLKT
ncbi:hypothetical protein ND810_08175 [Leptospira levettii]|uniref:Uncharacterized protein n=1 Tax=Leptospira levettii TaxID=2023178 RepID=A0AAW5V648_9LEPT|nr:hypothetical protein [Leptospira levettii]MCW7464439.1 hypothetical protein [Leptospira levettii]MCW7515131.1 hypothetical protein [Leptospira levettii]